MAKTEVVILAAGHGTRMRSKQPKSLQKIGGQPMLSYILATVKAASVDQIHVVIGQDGDLIQEQFPNLGINWVIQEQPLGTGHAVAQALPHIEPSSIVCVLYGDNPFIRAETVTHLISVAASQGLSILTAMVEMAAGYGRIVRDVRGGLLKIVEEKDATKTELLIKEVNAGPMAIKTELLASWLLRLDNNNEQKEYYLPGILDFAVASGMAVPTVTSQDLSEIAGINSRSDQAKLERKLQLKNAESLMLSGVQLMDPARFDLRGTFEAGKDCLIDVNVILEGTVVLADQVEIQANNIIRDSVIGKGVKIKPNCVIENAVIEAGCEIGPFARIRPGSVIRKNARVGNYVEIKNSTLGKYTKVSHLSYVGDSDIGDHVNIGAGVITCNYDGKKKHKTKIGNHVFVGSNVALIAPIKIEDHAMIGAGSTISKNVGEFQLVVERAKSRVSDLRKK